MCLMLLLIGVTTLKCMHQNLTRAATRTCMRAVGCCGMFFLSQAEVIGYEADHSTVIKLPSGFKLPDGFKEKRLVPCHIPLQPV